jgi:MFS family permease
MRRASLLVLFLTVFIDLIGFGMVIPFLAFYAREYGASGVAVGAVVGVFSIMQFLFAPLWGRLSDRVGRRPVILISLLAACLGYTLFAFARSYVVLFISRIIAGAGGASIGTAQAYIADSTPPEGRARGMGLIGAAFGIGFIVGPPMSGILSAIGVRQGLAGNFLPGIVAASLSIIAFLVALFVLGESKPPDLKPRSGLPPQFDKNVWHDVRTHPLISLAIVAMFLTMMSVAGMETSVTLHARDRFDFQQIDLAYLFLVMGLVVATIQGGLLGRLVKKLGEKNLVIIGTLSFTLGLGLIPQVYRPTLLFVVAILVAIGQGLVYPSLTSLISRASPPGEQGSFLGLAVSIGSLARFVGPILSGFLYDLAQARGSFYGGAIMTAIAFLIVRKIRVERIA